MFAPPTVTVSEITRYVREVLESDPGLKNIWVRGEISNFSRPSSGHLYFTLKDQGAALKCVMWRTSASRQAYLPTDGAAVQVHGAIGVYEAGGQYQLYVDALRPAGEGALFQEFMRLKARLEAQGLFDSARKRPIPERPQRIGIITSPTGAALRDMLNTIIRRYPIVEVILAATAVQGDEAPSGIVSAIAALNFLKPAPDVILLARGGGSIEDLWAFNDERVALAIAGSQIPTITGVGHETDFTIADFVADLRAPTPTAAAELATPDAAELRKNLDGLVEQLNHSVEYVISEKRWALTEQQRRLALYSPASRLRSDQQYLDEFLARLKRAAVHQLDRKHSLLVGKQGLLEALNPLEVLRRGFVLVTRPDGRLLVRADQVLTDDLLRLRFQDGERAARALPIDTPANVPAAEG